MSLKVRLIVIVSLSIILIVGAMSVFVFSNTRAITTQSHYNLALAKAQGDANELTSFLNQKAERLKAFAKQTANLSKLPQNDEEKIEHIQYLLADMSMEVGISDAYLVLEKGTFFKADSLNSNYFNIEYAMGENGEPMIFVDANYEVAEDDDWYNKAKETGKTFLVEPYKYTYDWEKKERSMITVSHPVVLNGKIIGVVGVDIELATLQKIIFDKMKIDSIGAYALFVSYEGLRAGHPNPKNWFVPIGHDMEPSAQKKLQDAIKKGETYRVEKKAVGTGEMSLITYVPVLVNGTDRPWSLGYVLSFTKMQASLVDLEKFVITFCFALIAIYIAFYYILFSKIFSVVSRSSKSMAKASKTNDLTIRLEVKDKKEFGRQAESFNSLVQNLQNSFIEVKKESASLAKESDKLTADNNAVFTMIQDTKDRADRVEQAIKEVKDEIQLIVSNAESVTANAVGVASSAEQMSTNISTVAAAVEEMSASIAEISDNSLEASKTSKDAGKKAAKATDAMRKLGSAAKEIGDVTDVIKKIADKTNLLALNATIEAASAGEAGKGFAVVAAEIKELANQSAKNADDIANRIEGIQAETNSAVKVIDSVVETIHEVDKSVDTIARSVQEEAKVTNEIANNVAQTNLGIKQVTSAISGVADVIKEVSKSTENAFKGSANVSSEAKTMNDYMQKAAKAVSGMGDTVNELVEMSKRLQNSVDEFRV